MKLNIAWTSDCQGKKDYDGDVVAISTRYWPGPVTVFDTSKPEKGLHEEPGGQPRAHCSIVLLDGATDHEGTTETLAEMKFVGGSFREVSRQVEAWAQEQMDRIATALRAEFRGSRP